MRSAEEYRKQFNLSDESSDELGLRCDDIEDAINEARKETIIECAKLVIFEPYISKMMLSLINKLQ